MYAICSRIGDARVARRAARGGVDEVLYPCRLGCVGERFALPYLALQPSALLRKALDAKHPIYAL